MKPIPYDIKPKRITLHEANGQFNKLSPRDAHMRQ